MSDALDQTLARASGLAVSRRPKYRLPDAEKAACREYAAGLRDGREPHRALGAPMALRRAGYELEKGSVGGKVAYRLRRVAEVTA